eukprot:GHRQ01013494.1.p2 GENE.GHRQ01013494.1~~GHRQ01013494.1.p2  ORF type:complete len:106 (+),score=8.87 GHRQ01013494.1:343-660(+)
MVLLCRRPTSMKSCLASSTPATSPNVTPVLGSIWKRALLLPNARGLLPPGPPMPPAPPLRRDSRNRPPTSSRGKARLPVARDTQRWQQAGKLRGYTKTAGVILRQ